VLWTGHALYVKDPDYFWHRLKLAEDRATIATSSIASYPSASGNSQSVFVRLAMSRIMLKRYAAMLFCSPINHGF
jgi:hypothetical protein